MKEILESAWRELTRRRTRMIVNVLGYFLAVSVMLVLVTWLQFSRRASDEILTTTGTHFIVSYPSAYCCPKSALKEGPETFVATGVTTQLFSTSVVDRIKRLPSIKDASPYLSFRFKDARDGHFFTVGGFDPAQQVSVASTTCAPADLSSGRFLLPWDRGVVMLEKAYADSRGLGVGTVLKIGGLKFPVVGIVAPATRPAKADVYMNIDDAEKAINSRRKVPFSWKKEINVVLVEAKSSRLQDKAIRDIGKIDQKFAINGFACYRPASRVMGINEKTIIFVILIIALGTLAFSVKAQLASVVERQRDIGILKSIGWSNRNIVSQVVMESAIQALLGAAFGCVAALYAVYLLPIKSFTGIENSMLSVDVSPVAIACAVVLALLGGMLAGLFPAWSAARKNPAEALRQL